MFRFIIIALLSLATCSPLFAVELVSTSLVKSFTIAELQDFYKKKKVPNFIVPVRYGVDIYKILYKTADAEGKLVTASGLFFVPQGFKQSMPLISYQHGTVVKKNEAPSALKGEYIIGLGLACDGYAVSMPDYLGLGDGEGRHLYLHAETEASASIDMLRACKTYGLQNNLAFNDMLFLAGYSQGGHSTMAMHKMLQEKCAGEFKVTASAPMSGPYDLAGVQSQVIARGGEYPQPGYLPYVLFSYNTAYKLFANPSQILLTPYDSILPAMLDGNYTMADLNKVMPKSPSEILRPEVLEAFVKDTANGLAKAMKANNLYNWVPAAPVKMCYCQGDEQVNYQNAFVAYKSFREQGAKQVQKAGMGKKFNHGKCAYYSLLYSKMWFDSFRKGSEHGRKGPVFKRMLLTLSKPAMVKDQRKWEKKKAEEQKQKQLTAAAK